MKVSIADKSLLGAGLVLTGSVLFSTKAILVKLAYRYDVDSISLLMLRMVFSLPFFLIIGIWAIRRTPGVLSVIKKSVWPLIIFGLSGFYAASFLDLEGLRYIDASLERIIIFVYPTIVVLMSFLWYKERINTTQTLAIFVSYLGIILAFGANVRVNLNDHVIKGAFLVFLSAVFYAAYIVGSQAMLKRMNTRIYNSIAMIIATIAILVHNGILHGYNLANFQAPVYFYALLISTIATVIPSFMVVEGIRLIGANDSAILGAIGPISTLILAHIILDERIGLVQWIGSIIVILGVVMVLKSRRTTT